MAETGSELTLAQMLVAGPRGRRMLMAFATNADPRSGDGFASAVFEASYELDPGKGISVGRLAATIGDGDAQPDIRPQPTVEDVSGLLDQLKLPPVTEESLRSALGSAADMARYWQPPDGEDVLAATASVRNSLVRVAEHIAASPYSQWWLTPVDHDDQWAVSWEEERNPDFPFKEPIADPVEHFSGTRKRQARAEKRAKRQQPKDPEKCWSGEWWSTPGAASVVPHTTRSLSDGSPAELWFVEDGFGWKRAAVRRLQVSSLNRIYEIDSAESWAHLCREFPLECTYQKRGDWYRTTGRDGRWVVPDWSRVVEHYDAVHLQPAAYLQAAGIAIPVDEDSASVIAGWDPDATYWLRDLIQYVGDPVMWVLMDTRPKRTWVEEGSERASLAEANIVEWRRKFAREYAGLDKEETVDGEE